MLGLLTIRRPDDLAAGRPTRGNQAFEFQSADDIRVFAIAVFTIGVFPVAMPDHLDRPQIVTRVSENEIQFDEFSRWAEPIKENFYTVLVENLSTLLSSEKIIKTAESLGVKVAFQVGVDVVQFDGALGGDVVLIAGKGHEDYQEIKGVKYPFDDKKILQELLQPSNQKPD